MILYSTMKKKEVEKKKKEKKIFCEPKNQNCQKSKQKNSMSLKDDDSNDSEL